MPALIPVVPQLTNNLGLNPPIYTETFQLTAAQIRSLNSVPVSLIPAPGTNIAFVPIRAIYILTAGSVVFSGAVTVHLAVGSVATAAIAMGTGSAAEVKVDNAGVTTTDYVASTTGIDAALTIASAADRTGGTGSVLTVIVTYALLDLTNILP